MQDINPITGKKNEVTILKGKKLGKRLNTKHAASKKGHKHAHHPSKGELNSAKFQKNVASYYSSDWEQAEDELVENSKK